MITPSQAFTALKTFFESQTDIIKQVCTEFDHPIQTPSLLLEVPQIVDIDNVNMSANSILVKYRFAVQIGSEELNPWNATGTVSDIASTLRIRLLQEFSKFNDGVFHDFSNLTFSGMPVFGLDSKNERALMVIARQVIEFALEEDAELEGILVNALHNRYKDWENTEIIREEITYADNSD